MKISFQLRYHQRVRLLAMISLVLYILGTSRLDLIHAVVHEHESVVDHSLEQESDPCHRLVYHHDTKKSCEHDEHLVVSDKCQLCDVIMHKDQILFDLIAFSQSKLDISTFLVYKQSLESYWAIISSSRAPPAITLFLVE